MTCREVDMVVARRDSAAYQLPQLGMFDVVARAAAGEVQVVILRDHAHHEWAVAVVSPVFGFGNAVERPSRPVTVRSVRNFESLAGATCARDAAVLLHRGMPRRVPLAVSA
jgi:hypothetical protein